MGSPRNYGPDSQEVEEEQRREADQRLRRQAQEQAHTERLEALEAQQRAACWEEWVGTRTAPCGKKQKSYLC